MASRLPFREWLDAGMLRADWTCPPPTRRPPPRPQPDTRARARRPRGTSRRGEAAGSVSRRGQTLSSYATRYGIGYEELTRSILPMAQRGGEPLASMGVDVPLAALSRQPRRLFDYFKQLFAQVTNPPIDALREDIVTSTVLYLGNHGNLLEAHARQLPAHPAGRALRPTTTPSGASAPYARRGSRSRAEPGVLRPRVRAGRPGRALDELDAQAERAVREGTNILVLSDRTQAGEVPIPSLLSLGSVHHHLIRSGLRTHVDLVVEAGDVASTHDFAALVGYSAQRRSPYAHAQIREAAARGLIEGDAEQACHAFDRAATAGIVSIMSKMGISTMQGYHSAQIFEALGLSGRGDAALLCRDVKQDRRPGHG